MHNPKDIKFIKLGEGGEYEKDCIEKNKTIKLGYNDINHQNCINGKWSLVEAELRTKGYSTEQGVITSHLNRIRKFYTEPAETMWITFYASKMWYCYAETQVTQNADGTKERETSGGAWKDSDIKGTKLFIQSLSGRLTKVQRFSGTICDVTEKTYALQKINGIQRQEVKDVETSLAGLKEHLTKLIQSLPWKDFETFVDLIFRASGWSRIGVVGKNVKAIDLELMAPVTGERAIVQIKSECDFSVFEEYKKKFQDLKYNKYFFVVHTASPDLSKYIKDEKEDLILIWDDEKLANLCINAGLIDWLITVTG